MTQADSVHSTPPTDTPIDPNPITVGAGNGAATRDIKSQLSDLETPLRKSAGLAYAIRAFANGGDLDKEAGNALDALATTLLDELVRGHFPGMGTHGIRLQAGGGIVKITKFEPYRYARTEFGFRTIYFGNSIDSEGLEYYWESETDGTVNYADVTRHGYSGARWPLYPPPTDLAEVVKQAVLKRSH